MPKIFIIFCFFSFYSEILAHSLKIFAKDEGSQINIKAYFYGGSPCKNCEILIQNASQVFKAKLSQNSNELEISINAGAGHYKSTKISLNKPQNNTSDFNKSSQQPQNKQSTQPKVENFTQDGQNSVFSELIKGFFAIIIILLIFAGLYFVKRRK